jgi:hypothetical protein
MKHVEPAANLKDYSGKECNFRCIPGSFLPLQFGMPHALVER